MTENIDTHEQFVLRVKKNCELDRMLRAASTADAPLTMKELTEIGGGVHRNLTYFLRCNSMFDNMRVVTKRGSEEVRATYYDTVPRTPIVVGTDTVSIAPEVMGISSSAPEISEIKWSQTPPIIDSMGDKFREPDWFDTMAAMVERGRHISLSGPPGVGKDTPFRSLPQGWARYS